MMNKILIQTNMTNDRIAIIKDGAVITLEFEEAKETAAVLAAEIARLKWNRFIRFIAPGRDDK